MKIDLFDVIRGENSPAQTLSRRDCFRLSQKQIDDRAFSAQVFCQHALEMKNVGLCFCGFKKV